MFQVVIKQSRDDVNPDGPPLIVESVLIELYDELVPGEGPCKIAALYATVAPGDDYEIDATTYAPSGVVMAEENFVLRR